MDLLGCHALFSTCRNRSEVIQLKAHLKRHCRYRSLMKLRTAHNVSFASKKKKQEAGYRTYNEFKIRYPRVAQISIFCSRKYVIRVSVINQSLLLIASLIRAAVALVFQREENVINSHGSSRNRRSRSRSRRKRSGGRRREKRGRDKGSFHPGPSIIVRRLMAG